MNLFLARLVSFLRGKRTYIVAAASVVVAALSYFGVIPPVDTLVAALIAIAGIAVTLRLALGSALDKILQSKEPEGLSLFSFPDDTAFGGVDLGVELEDVDCGSECCDPGCTCGDCDGCTPQ